MLIFGNQFNSELITLTGLDPTIVDLSTVQVDTFNLTGPTTVRVTLLTTVDSLKFAQLIQRTVTAAIDSGTLT
jgi:hypothetical protein